MMSWHGEVEWLLKLINLLFPQFFVMDHISPLLKSALFNNEIASDYFKGAYDMYFMVRVMCDCDRLIASEDFKWEFDMRFGLSAMADSVIASAKVNGIS